MPAAAEPSTAPAQQDPAEHEAAEVDPARPATTARRRPALHVVAGQPQSLLRQRVGLLRLAQCVHRCRAGQTDGRVEVPLGLRQPGAGVDADGAAPGRDEVRRRRDPGPGREQRPVELSCGALAGLPGLLGVRQRLVQGRPGLVQPTQRGQRIAAAGTVLATDLPTGRSQRRLRPRDRCGQLRAGQQPGLGQIRLDLRARLDQPVRGLGQLVGEPPDPVEERAGLLDRLLRGARRHRRGGALVGRELGTRLLDLGAGDVEPGRGLRDVVGDRLQRRSRIAGAQRVERSGRPGDAAGRRRQLRLEARQYLGQVLLEVAQAVEGGRLGVETLVRGGAQVQDLAEEAAAGGFVGLLVVNALA